jgi:hypothetical protein
MFMDCCKELSPGAVEGVLQCFGFCFKLEEGVDNGVDRFDFIRGVGVAWVVVVYEGDEVCCVCV